MQRRSATETVIGTLNVLTGGLMMWGGAAEVQAYLGLEAWAVSIGALGFLAGTAFAASGIALLRARAGARRLVVRGACASALVHALGVATGLIGIPGLIMGVGYPLLAMIYARRRPPAALASAENPDATRVRTGETGPRDDGRRIAIAF